MQLHNLDAIIMAHTTSMEHIKLKLVMASFCDYRSIMAPLMKTFMQVSLCFSGLVCSLININWHNNIVSYCFEV
jgi:hypothetical protein